MVIILDYDYLTCIDGIRHPVDNMFAFYWSPQVYSDCLDFNYAHINSQINLDQLLNGNGIAHSTKDNGDQPFVRIK